MPNRAMREERKVVTALFADIVGSTAVTEQGDAEDVHELVNEALALAINAAESLGGTVKDLAGDGALILFGAPVSHEDDAERAVRAGLEIVRAIDEDAARRRIEGIHGVSMRVGVETGLVVLGPVGGGSRVEYGATGDAVNTAARLQALADPGTVLVGPGTFERVRSRFSWGEPARVELKGKSTPITVHVARAPVPRVGSARSPDTGATHFVDRTREAAQLRTRLEELATGAGGVVLVTGDAGIGKSRLLDEARTTAPGGLGWIEARSASYLERTPYSVFRDLLLDAYAVGSSQELLELLSSLAHDRSEAFASFAAVLAGVGEGGATARASTVSPASLQRGLIEVVQRALDHRRAGRPLVVAIEDLQWADLSSLELLDAVIEATRGDEILIVITTRREHGRPSEGFVERSAARGALTVHLEPLDDAAAGELLVALSGSSVLPDAIAQRVLEAAEGNALYLEELVRSLRDAGALQAGAEGLWLDPDVPIVVPSTVELVILARLDRLSDEDRQLVDVASVIGRSFDRALLAGCMGRVPSELTDPIDRLEQLDLVRRSPEPTSGSSDAPAERFEFVHGLVQETAYRALVRRRSKPLHVRVARELEARAGRNTGVASVIGRHYLAGGEPAAALDWMVAAAGEAGRTQARSAAVQAYDEAIAATEAAGLGPSSAVVAGLRIERAGVLARRGDVQDARVELERALAEVGDGDQLLTCRAEAELGFVLAGAYDYRAALPHLEAALRIAEMRGDAEARVTALARLSIVHTNMLRFDLGRGDGERALSVARASGRDQLVAVALDALKQAALELGDRAALEEIADELEAMHRWNDELWLLQFVLVERAYMSIGTARWDEADVRLTEAIEVNRRLGDRGNEILHLSMRGWNERGRGQLAVALGTLEEATSRAREMRHAEWIAFSSLFLGATWLDLEEPRRAAGPLTDAVDAAEEAGAILHLVRALGLSAWCSMLLGDRDVSADLAARTTAILDGVVCPPGTAYLPGADAYVATGRVLLELGDVARAAELVRSITEVARRHGWVEASVGGAIVLGRCAELTGAATDALGTYREAVALAHQAGMPVMERDARRALAAALAASAPDESGHQSSVAGQLAARLRAEGPGAKLDPGAAQLARGGSLGD